MSIRLYVQDVVLARPCMRFPTADPQYPLLGAEEKDADANKGVSALKGALRRSSPFDSVTSNEGRLPNGHRRFSMEDAAPPLCVHHPLGSRGDMSLGRPRQLPWRRVCTVHDVLPH